jgi:type II secretory pathway pseudopilin PulG
MFDFLGLGSSILGGFMDFRARKKAKKEEARAMYREAQDEYNMMQKELTATASDLRTKVTHQAAMSDLYGTGVDQVNLWERGESSRLTSAFGAKVAGISGLGKGVRKGARLMASQSAPKPPPGPRFPSSGAFA